MKGWQDRPAVPCADCGRPCWGTRCRPCYRIATAARPRPALQNSWRERRRRAAAVIAWIEQNGLVCPGWGRDPHPAARLSADHVVPVGAGGPESGPLGILCPRCNSAKRDRTVDPRVAARREWPGAGGDRRW